jgi:hypothetical protein
LQARRAALQPNWQTWLSRCSPAAVHSRNVAPLHQRADGMQPKHSPVAGLHPFAQAMVWVEEPSALHTTELPPEHDREFGRQLLQAPAAALQPCGQAVIVMTPLSSQA